MNYDVTKFPIEIQEMILSKLSDQELVSMSKVCQLWHAVCGWIARKKYSEIIPEECIIEIKNSGVPGDDVWLTAINYRILSKSVSDNILDQKKNILIELNENKHRCFCIHGPLIFIGCNSNSIVAELEVYNQQESLQPVLNLTFQENPVSQIEIMPNKKLLLAKTGRNSIALFSLPYFTGKSWVYKMTHLKPNIQNFTGELHCERNFSVCGTRFATATNTREICVFQVDNVGKNTVTLHCLSNYVTNEPVEHVSIWRDEVIVLFNGGEILRWCLSTQNSFTSERYHEFFYSNPVWIFRGRIFCSTHISSKLLGYWRMDTGADYWLLGKPSCDLVRCRDLGTMFCPDMGVEDVLCVCLRQQLLACGTGNGKILLYYLSDKFFSPEEFDINGNDHMTREFNRAPDLIIKTKDRYIWNIDIKFYENCIKIYTWPYLINTRPDVQGLLQCITLKKGGSAIQSDTDFFGF